MDQNNISVSVSQNREMPITDASKYIRQKYGKMIIIVSVVLMILEAVLFIGSIYFQQVSNILFELILLPIVIFAIIYRVIQRKAEDAFFQQFATINKFSFQESGLPENLLGSLFFVGNSPLGYDLVSGIYQKIPFILFNYQYTIGEGKNRSTYNYTIFRLDFASSLPPIFLKPKYCNFGGFFFGDISKEAKEKLELEGDFDKYFDLWTKEDFETEALQVFAPDFMLKIEDNWKKFSLEFVNNQIYIYSDHMIKKDEELENMYQLIQYLVAKIAPFAEETKEDIDAMDTYNKS